MDFSALVFYILYFCLLDLATSYAHPLQGFPLSSQLAPWGFVEMYLTGEAGGLLRKYIYVEGAAVGFGSESQAGNRKNTAGVEPWGCWIRSRTANVWMRYLPWKGP